MARTQSELQVITAAKKLCSYVMTITQKAPKQFRFSLVGRMQGYVLDIVEDLYYANDIYIQAASQSGWAQRQAFQRKALASLKLLSYIAQVSMEQKAIQPGQYEQISQQSYNTQNLLGAWINSDRKRMDCGNRISEKMQQGSTSE